MSQLNRTIKQNSEKAIKGNWGKAIAIVLLTVAISLLFTIFETIISISLGLPSFVDISYTVQNFIDDVPTSDIWVLALTCTIAVFSALVMTPLNMGVSNWFYKLSGGIKEDISFVFSYFDSLKMYFKTIWLKLNINLRIFGFMMIMLFFNLWLAFFTAPFVNASPSRTDLMLAAVGIILNLILIMIELIFIWIFSFRYFLAQYLIFEDKDLSVRTAIKKSIEITKGHKQDLFFFQLSFIGWYFLSFFMFPTLYVMPYTSTSFSIYARYLIFQQEQSEKSEFTKEFAIDLEAPNTRVEEISE